MYTLLRQLLLLFFLPAAVFAASPIRQDLSFRNLCVADGLSDNYVRSILRDHRGAMWFVACNNVDRYDGYRFRHYVMDRSFYRNDGLHDIYQSADNTIWVTGTDHVYTYHEREDYIGHDIQPTLLRYGILDSITFLRVDAEHNLWCADEGGCTLYHYDFAAHKLSQFPLLRGRSILDLASRGGSTWMLTEKCLTAVGKNREIPLPIQADRRTHLYIDSTGRVWLFVNGESAIWRYDDSSDIWLDMTRLPALKGTMLIAICDGGAGLIYLGTGNRGVLTVDLQDNVVPLPMSNQTDYHLTDNHIGSFYIDAALSTLWVGTTKQGVAYADLQQTPFSVLHMPMDEDISCLLVDSTGCLWMGFDSQGIGRTNLLHSPNDILHSTDIPSKQVISSMLDSKGRLWWGSYEGPLFQTSPGRPTWVFKDGPNSVVNMTEDSQGHIWAATFSYGLYCIDLRTGQTETYTAENSALTTNWLTKLQFGQSDTLLYIGTSRGLFTLNIKSRTVRKIMPGDVRDICFAADGTLWVGLRDGLVAYDIADSSQQRLTAADGLANNMVCGLAEDHYGTMWVSTMNGITRVIPRRGQDGTTVYLCHTIQRADGLGTTSFNPRAVTCTPDGDIIVGSLGWLVRITPTMPSSAPDERRTYFSSLTIAGQHVEVGDSLPDGRIPLRCNLMLTDTLRLRYSDTDIALELSTMNYLRSRHQRYLYRIGRHDVWHTIEGHAVMLSHLDPGHHLLQVKAVAGLPDEDCPITEMLLIVAPPWWRSWAAYACYILLLTGLVALGILRIRRRHQRRIQRQRREQELRQRQEMDEAKMRFFTNVSHDMRTPLSLIIAPVERLLKRNLDAETRRQLEIVNRSAVTLRDEITQLLDFRKLDEVSETPVMTTGDLSQFVQEACGELTRTYLPAGVHLRLELCHEALITCFDPSKMQRVLLNLVSNAIKYNRQDGDIVVRTRLEQDGSQTYALLQVADTGIGIRPENREHIFERFFQENHDDTTYVGSGIGLYLVRQYVRMQGGTISVEDNVPQGTVFTVRMKTSTIAAASLNPAPPILSAKKPSLLIVEDNDDFRTFISDSLADRYEVVMASNGSEALDILRRRDDIALIVSDIMMPVMDGMELLRRVKQDVQMSHTPVIMLTAKATDESQIQGLRDGADDYVTKPFNIDVLTLRIERLMHWRQTAPERFRKLDVQPSDITVSHVDEQLISQAIALVEKNIAETDYSVEQFCEDMGMSRSSLYKKLIAITGLSPLHFIRTIRVKRGRVLLEKSGDAVSQVAYKVGLSSKQFAKYFKEAYGISPSELSSHHHAPINDVFSIPKHS